VVAQARSLVRVTRPLFEIIAEAVEKTFPTKKITLKALSRAVGTFESQSGEQTKLVLIVPPRRKKEKMVLDLVFDEIRGNKVRARLLFPLYGTARQQDIILRILLGGLNIKKKGEIFVQDASVVVIVNLPFAPAETSDEESGKCGDGQQLFACPKEVISVP
jgi:hypothetical protein